MARLLSAASCRARRAGPVAWGAASALLLLGGFAWAGERSKRDSSEIIRGQALFLTEWVPNDPRSHGGDGLGPVYNDTSCVACHNLGGPGGAGASEKNVELLTAFSNEELGRGGITGIDAAFMLLQALGGRFPKKTPPPPADRAALFKLHPGFRAARSTVVHKFSTHPDYPKWRDSLFQTAEVLSGRTDLRERARLETMLGLDRTEHQLPIEYAGFELTPSQRNPLPLFGAGRIGALPDAVLLAAEQRRFPDFPDISGRVSRLKDGRIGRFGWKAQVASLDDFVLTACAVELGLEVPGQHQGLSPQEPDQRPKGLDLTEQECADLTAFVRSLPKPLDRSQGGGPEGDVLRAGRQIFDRIGCATCHTPNLGDLTGIYSDLLLHDMGFQLSDTGVYGGTLEQAPSEQLPDPRKPMAEAESAAARGVVAKPPSGVASAREWRTPPLWGFRDSGPYLHDGRAKNLEQAVAIHGGEAESVAFRFFRLSAAERERVEAFLKSLVAPIPPPREEGENPPAGEDDLRDLAPRSSRAA